MDPGYPQVGEEGVREVACPWVVLREVEFLEASGLLATQPWAESLEEVCPLEGALVVEWLYPSVVVHEAEVCWRVEVLLVQQVYPAAWPEQEGTWLTPEASVATCPTRLWLLAWKLGTHERMGNQGVEEVLEEKVDR